MVSTDRRSVRTRAALRLALAQEIDATGDLSRVTVTAVTERAGLTRRTFYSHYRDIPDLVGQIEAETLSDLREHVEKIARADLGDLEAALLRQEAAPGSEDLLRAVRERGDYLRPLLGDGGDPAFAERLKRMAYDAVAGRALDGIDVRAVGTFFDYYLTYAISAEVGVLLRWLEGGMRESVEAMARLMTALMFVRPGDLYGKPIDFDIPRFALAIMRCEERHNVR
ncbi:MAG: TetR-like C-terminal domain-containing protein [Coriobacteriia bacterium]|nr:TetR-like C-terminal domain-containing protein [Coriobacteriia bacterium]